MTTSKATRMGCNAVRFGARLDDIVAEAKRLAILHGRHIADAYLIGAGLL